MTVLAAAAAAGIFVGLQWLPRSAERAPAGWLFPGPPESVPPVPASGPAGPDGATLPQERVEPLWRAIDETAVDGPLPNFDARWTAEGRALVSVSGTVAASRGWRVGDRLVFPLPQLGESYRAVIEEVDEGPGGAIAAVGRFAAGDGGLRRWVVTAGPGNVFAWVDTPAGPYELRADADVGWLLPSASMAAMDYVGPDYFLPRAGGTGLTGGFGQDDR